MMSRRADGHAAAALLGGLGGLRIDGAPWWAVFLLGMAVLGVVLVGTVFPQESAHRLAWWRDWRKERRWGRNVSGRR